MLKNIFSTTAFLLLIFTFSLGAAAQTGKQEQTNNSSGKKNARPGETKIETEKPAVKTSDSVDYFYEFSQPQFVVSHVRIEHDENGKGTITLAKMDFDEEYTDPIQLSDATLEKIKTLWNALDFLNSDEDYQSKERDYGHIGNMTFKMQKGENARTAKFNWSENADAQELAHEYKKITNQFVWMFDITVSRENQPLESPRIMKSLDSLLRRDEVSDPQQMIPFLKKLSEDERVPLITRNYALRLVKEIDKKNKK